MQRSKKEEPPHAPLAQLVEQLFPGSTRKHDEGQSPPGLGPDPEFDAESQLLWLLPKDVVAGRPQNAPLAQLVEQLTLNQWVPGSSP